MTRLDRFTVDRVLEFLRQNAKEAQTPNRYALPIEIDDESGWNAAKKRLLDLCFDGDESPDGWCDNGVECLQCSDARCVHRQPRETDEVFVRYTPNGKPSYQKFADVLLEHRADLAGQLYRRTDAIIDLLVVKPQAVDPLLVNVNRRLETNIEGILYLGYLKSHRFSAASRTALSIVLLEQHGHWRLHYIGVKPQDFQRLAELPDNDHLRIVNRAMQTARRKLKRLSRQIRSRIADQQMSPLTILKQLGTAVRRGSTHGHKRTKHANVRHQQGDRPTGDALKDAMRVGLNRLLFDEKKETWVVLGRRGRAHLFGKSGKHVTSIRLAQGEIERKKAGGRWREVGADDLARFTALLGSKT